MPAAMVDRSPNCPVIASEGYRSLHWPPFFEGFSEGRLRGDRFSMRSGSARCIEGHRRRFAVAFPCAVPAHSACSILFAPMRCACASHMLPPSLLPPCATGAPRIRLASQAGRTRFRHDRDRAIHGLRTSSEVLQPHVSHPLPIVSHFAPVCIWCPKAGWCAICGVHPISAA